MTITRLNPRDVGILEWPLGANLNAVTGSGTEWSVDMNPGSKTGAYWQVWSNMKGSVLQCYHDDAKVSVPNGKLYVQGRDVSEPNVTIGEATNASNVTTTSHINIVSISHTSRTGRVLLYGNMILKTSRYTSSMNIYTGSTNLRGWRTNITSPTRICGHVFTTQTIGSAVTYYLRMDSQDSGTTATFPSYTTAEIMAIDI